MTELGKRIIHLDPRKVQFVCHAIIVRPGSGVAPGEPNPFYTEDG